MISIILDLKTLPNLAVDRLGFPFFTHCNQLQWQPVEILLCSRVVSVRQHVQFLRVQDNRVVDAEPIVQRQRLDFIIRVRQNPALVRLALQ